jgi:hypothetical protein
MSQRPAAGTTTRRLPRLAVASIAVEAHANQATAGPRRRRARYPEDHMLKTAVEATTLIGVAAAVIAGAFYAMGTVAYLSYLNALGFDAHQFASAGLELQLMGLTYMAVPAIYIIGWLIVIVAGTIAIMKRVDARCQKLEQKPKLRVLGAVICGAVIGLAMYWLGVPGIDLQTVALGAALIHLILVPRVLAATMAGRPFSLCA